MESPKDIIKIIELFRKGPSILEDALTGLDERDLDFKPANGGWTIRQIVHHLADGDDLWKAGIKMALGNEQAEFSLNWYLALPQTEWAKLWHYESRSLDTSLELLRANRDHVLQLLEHVKDGWNKSVQYIGIKGEVEKVPVGFIVDMQANHILHHVKRIKEIRKEIEKS